MKQDSVARRDLPSTLSSHVSYQQITPPGVLELQAPPPYTQSETPASSQARDAYIPEPAMTATYSEPNYWAKYDDLGGCCFSTKGGCCFSRRGGCCFSDTEGCCFSKNRGCCFSSGAVSALPFMPYIVYLVTEQNRYTASSLAGCIS